MRVLFQEHRNAEHAQREAIGCIRHFLLVSTFTIFTSFVSKLPADNDRNNDQKKPLARKDVTSGRLLVMVLPALRHTVAPTAISLEGVGISCSYGGVGDQETYTENDLQFPSKFRFVDAHTRPWPRLKWKMY